MQILGMQGMIQIHLPKLPLGIKPRPYYVQAALLSFLGHMCGVCMANWSCYMYKGAAKLFKKNAAPLRTLANKVIMQHNCYVSFRCRGVLCDSRYVVRSQANS